MKKYKRNQKIKHYNVGKDNGMFGEHYNKYNITKKLLIEEYSKKEKSIYKIAKEIGCSITPIYDRLKKYNIPRRTLSEAFKGIPKSEKYRKKMSLVQGGTGIPREFSDYPDKFFRIRLKILKRDNHTCQLCKRTSNEVHHIDYNKENSKESNLISLCHKCNMKANFNRDYWYAYFSYLMEEK